MSSGMIYRRFAGVAMMAVMGIAGPVAASAAAKPCGKVLSSGIPKRSLAARSGSELMKTLMATSGSQRDEALTEEVLAGNVPRFMRKLTPVTIEGKDSKGNEATVTLCVTPEYLSVGNNRDFVRVPMGLPAAVRVAEELGFLLPTPKMVDAIYSQADIQLAPSPMKPTPQMESTAYFVEHDATVDRQGKESRAALGDLTAGQKKDIVLTSRLREKSGRVAIYGWHRTNGKPIQPLSTVHGAEYADYSHGVRLISRTAFFNGKPVDLKDLMQDRELASLVNHEGPIDDLNELVESLY